MNNSINRQKRYYRNLLAGILIILVVAIFGGKSLRQSMIHNAAQQMGTRCAELYDGLEEQMIQNVRVALMDSESEMEYFLSNGSKEDISAFLRMTDKMIRQQCNYSKIEIFAFRNGQLIEETGTNQSMSNLKIPDWYDEAIQNAGDVYFSDLYESPNSGELMVSVIYISPDTKNAIGYRVAAKDFIKESSNEKMPEGAAFALFDSDWNPVAHISQENMFSEEHLQSAVFPKLIELYEENGDKRSTVLNHNRTRYYIYFSDLSVGWHTVFAFPESSLTTNIESQWYLYYACVGALLVMLLLAAIIVHKKNNMAIENRILSRFSDVFDSGYFVNLKTRAFSVIKEPDENAISKLKDTPDIVELWQLFLNRDVHPEDKEKLNEIFAFSTLQKHLNGEPILSCEFRHNRYGWCRFTCMPVDYAEDGSVLTALFSITVIEQEKQIQTRLEQENRNLDEVLRAASYMFDRLFVVDLETEKYTYSYIKDTVENREAMKQATIDGFKATGKSRFFNSNTGEPVTKPFTQAGLDELLKDSDDYYFEYKDLLSGNKILGATVHCIERKKGVPTRVIYAIRDVTNAKLGELQYRKQLKEANEKLADIANHDQLTGLYNRRGFEEMLRLNMITAPKAALLIIDVDRFKSVNDTYGHPNGDKLLAKVARLLKDSFRTNDILVRLGGDEFMAVLLNCDISQADFIPAKINRINEMLANPSDDTPPGSISVGVAFSRENETSELYQRADEALYHAKENGRHGCMIYEFMEQDADSKPHD